MTNFAHGSPVADTVQSRDGSSGIARPGMFFRRWIAHPLQMGSVVPSSASLCRRVVDQIRRTPDEAVLELGAGTGVISRALLYGGIPPGRLIVVEIEGEMVSHLRRALPGVTVLEGDAKYLPELVSSAWHGRVGTVVCGIPLVMLPLAEQKRFIDAIDAVAPGRGFLHYSYCITSPLPWKRHGLVARREAWTPLNFPPASLWRYVPIAAC